MNLHPISATDPIHAPAVPSKHFDRWWLTRIDTKPGTDRAIGYFCLGRRLPTGDWEFPPRAIRRTVILELDDHQHYADLVGAVLQAFETEGKAQGIL